jgi:glycosyltransferase involved in cell wall biosynthesis
MTKRVLLLAYMFPPIVDGGGFRPFAFARYLPEFGYEPIVLTRPDSGDLPLDARQLEKLPPSVRVERVATGFADGWTEHFRRRLLWLRPLEAVLNKPRGWIAEAVAWRAAHRDQLDQWETAWMRPAVERGLHLIRQFRPDVLLATAPPFETLKAALILHERTGVPFVADFRDPWTYGVLWNPANARRARLETAWEARVVAGAARVLVVTPSMQRHMADTYPDAAGKIELLMNGYEELPEIEMTPSPNRFVLSYVGAIMERRLPPVLFEALRRLRASHPEAAADARVQLVGHNHCRYSLPDRIRTEGLSDMVEWVGAVNQEQARALMRSSQVLLHIETTAEYAVSGKLFEYLAARRPILGMTLPGSDDEGFLHQSGAGSNVGFDDADRIASAIAERWEAWREHRLVSTVNETWLKQFHRREQTRTLAHVLDSVASREPHPVTAAVGFETRIRAGSETATDDC